MLAHTPTRLTRFAAVAVLVLAVLLLGCAGAAAPTSVADPGGRPTAGPAQPRPGDGAAPPADLPLDGALIVRTGQLELEVTDLAAAVAAGQQAIAGLGGYVEVSEQRQDDFAAWAEVSYRLPVAQWDAALAAIRGLGEVLTETTDARDVTAAVVDLDARLQNLRVTEAALQAIMDRATTIDDVLEVQRELTGVRAEIERLTAQRDELAGRAAMSTLSVSYRQPGEPVAQAAEGWDAGREVDSAVAALVVVLQRLASLGIWLGIAVLPVVLPVVVLIWLAYRLARRRTRTA